MFDWHLPLFPAHSTAATVTITVWIGVCVVVFFNTRFGWTLSGLVVPGYVVPLLLVKPVAVAIIFGEAIATYLIGRVVSDSLRHRAFWSSFFGRDRFLALVLISVLVRAWADGWMLPAFGKWVNEALGIQFDYRNDLHSYGLIVVALIANYFWKPGLPRGLATSLTAVGITYGIVQMALLRVTNLNIGSLYFLYDDVSTSLLSSPKAYVLVITTAVIASQMNLRYSWDFNGILVPSLLGLLWHDPLKIVVTIAESFWVLGLASIVLRLPIWSRVTMEGGRKLLLFFSIAAAHRLALAHLLPVFSEIHVTDAYGFGYLVTTLMAVRAHDKNIPLRVCRATLQTSMMGAVAGSVLGYGLSFVSVDGPQTTNASKNASSLSVVDRFDGSLWDSLSRARLQLYRTKMPGSYQRALPVEMSHFRMGVLRTLDYVRDRRDTDLEQAIHELAQANFGVTIVGGKYVVLTERDPNRGWGTYVLNLEPGNQLLVEAPVPLDEWATFEFACKAFTEFNARALAVGGTLRQANSDRSSDMLLQRGTMLSTFHRLVSPDDVLQVRGWTESLVRTRKAVSKRSSDVRAAVSSATSELWVKRSLPPSLNLTALSKLAQFTQARWGNVPASNVLRQQSPRGYAELILSRHDRQRVRNRVFTREYNVGGLQRFHGHLTSWLAEDRALIARQATNAFVPPVVEEMLFLDDEVLRPLILLCQQVHDFAAMTPEQLRECEAVAAAARVLDYQLTMIRDAGTEDEYFALTENAPRQRHWGTYVFRLGLTSPHVVEVPRPLFERQTHEFAIRLFQIQRASALLVAGAHPFANTDGTADVTRMANRVNAFQLVRQVLLREFFFEPMLLIQTRAIQAPVDADVVVATDDGTSRYDQLPELEREIVDTLENDDLRTVLVDGSERLAGYEVGIHFQAWTLNHAQHKRMVSLWLSPSIRRKFRSSESMRLNAAQCQALGIETITGYLEEYLATFDNRLPQPVPRTLWDQLNHFRRNSDIVVLYNAQRDHPSTRWKRFIDIASDQEFILVETHPDAIPFVFNVNALNTNRSTITRPTVRRVREYVRSRDFMLEVRQP